MTNFKYFYYSQNDITCFRSRAQWQSWFQFRKNELLTYTGCNHDSRDICEVICEAFQTRIFHASAIDSFRNSQSCRNYSRARAIVRVHARKRFNHTRCLNVSRRATANVDGNRMGHFHDKRRFNNGVPTSNGTTTNSQVLQAFHVFFPANNRPPTNWINLEPIIWKQRSDCPVHTTSSAKR